MKTIAVSRFGDESVLQYTEASLPQPGPGQVLVRLLAAGVNPVETYIRAGKYGSLPSLPWTPGNDGSGVIDQLGPDVSGLEVGQRVVVCTVKARRNSGTYAEYCVCDAGAVRPLPPAVSFAQAAGLGTPGLAAAYGLFTKADLKAGETVLIHGATGGVGTLAVQLARQAGAAVLGTAGTAEGAEILREIGAHQVFNHKEAGYLDKIRASLPDGPDVILEMLADVNLMHDLDLLKKRGRISIVGSRGKLDFDPRQVMAKDASIHGVLLTNMTDDEYSENMARLVAAMENGMRVIVDRELPLEEARLAHKEVMEGKGAGKIVLIP